MPRLDYVFATVSPYSYLALPRLRALAENQGLEVHFRPVDPAGLFARTGGQVLAERHESRRAYRLQDLPRQAAKAGLPLVLQPKVLPVNPAPSAYAIIAAQKAKEASGAGDLFALVEAFGRALWAEERDIADDSVIKPLLAAAGFDPGLADWALLSAAETYAANLEWAVGEGVFGLPFFIWGGEKFWGQDRLADLEAVIEGRL